MRAGIGAGLAVAILVLAACDNALQAPTNMGVCWRMTTDAGGKPDFQPLSTGINNLETCGAHLEAVSLRENKPRVTGAYQGQYIFITPEMVQSSMHLKGVRYRLFDASTRGKVDHDLKWMLEDERHPSQFGPQGPGIGAAPIRPPSR